MNRVDMAGTSSSLTGPEGSEGHRAQDTLIKDATLETFAADVIHASATCPVLVDFWADWCGPCKQLTPHLEAAVTAQRGRVRLVKVNADQNQQLCAQLQIQSLPTVLVFWQGRPVDGFQGALPPGELKRFMAKIADMAGEAQDSLAEAMKQADGMLAEGKADEAAALYSQICQVEPSHIPARLGLGEAHLVRSDPNLEAVAGLLDSIDTTDLSPEEAARYRKICAALELRQSDADVGEIAALMAQIDTDPDNFAARFKLALAHQAAGAMDEAAEALLAIILRDREWEEGKARDQLLKFFEAAGPMDPFTIKYRRRLSSLLFS